MTADLYKKVKPKKTLFAAWLGVKVAAVLVCMQLALLFPIGLAFGAFTTLSAVLLLVALH